MNNILIESPTRVDLAGGTIDLWPLYNFLGGAKTVNLAIDIMTSVEIQSLGGESIELQSEDLGLVKSYPNLQACFADPDPKLKLLHIQLEYWRPRGGFRLITKSQSPVGGGLGGSSSLTISLLKAFSKWQQGSGPSKFKDIHAMVTTAHNLESHVLNTPTGTQDYYPAASGGLNCLQYSADGIEQEVVSLEDGIIQSHFMLIYTGKSHHSGINNFEVVSKAVAGDKHTMKYLHELKEVAEDTWTACKKKQFHEIPALFRREFAARVKLTQAFTSPEIEKLHDVSLQAGAQAVKICGAGGGGCVLLWVPPETQLKVGEACQRNGFKVLAAKPVAPLPQVMFKADH